MAVTQTLPGDLFQLETFQSKIDYWTGTDPEFLSGAFPAETTH